MAGVYQRFKNSLKHSWNLFRDEDYRKGIHTEERGYGYYGNSPNRRPTYSNERSIISSIYTRLGIDVSAVDIRHVRLDADGRYLEDMNSSLQNCLTVEANIDQGARHFQQDMATTLFDKGVIAIVPIEVSDNPVESNTFDILSMRVGYVVEWFPEHVRVRLYNDRTGLQEEITVSKRYAAIVENPLYSVMNEPNSTLQRLIRKLNMLDAVDEQSSSGKLDLIIQLPYVIKSEARRQQAEQRRQDIEHQLKGSQYGIAYTDGTEKITQLNRPAENNLLKQIEYLTVMLYSQLGLTEEVMNGTADEATMNNYYERTINPILDAIVEAMARTFLTKTARTQKQSIKYYRNPFKNVPMKDLAEIADKFTRNEILSANEIRGAIGIKPSKDPKADQLVNSNMPTPPTTAPSIPTSIETGGNGQNGT
jgi:hypothetical protein